ncbi:hypothetical protein [Stetteria hydrogenophila]
MERANASGVDVEAEALALARLRLELASYDGEYVEAAREASKLLLVIEDFLVYAASRAGLALKAARLVAGRLRSLIGLKDDPPSLFREARRLARLAVVARLYAEASGRVYTASLAVSTLLAGVLLALTLYSQATLLGALLAALGFGLLTAATLLSGSRSSIALAAAAVALQLAPLKLIPLVAAEALAIALGLAASRLLEARGESELERVASVEAG